MRPENSLFESLISIRISHQILINSQDKAQWASQGIFSIELTHWLKRRAIKFQFFEGLFGFRKTISTFKYLMHFIWKFWNRVFIEIFFLLLLPYSSCFCRVYLVLVLVFLGGWGGAGKRDLFWTIWPILSWRKTWTITSLFLPSWIRLNFQSRCVCFGALFAPGSGEHHIGQGQ